MTSPAELLAKFNGEVAHDVAVLLKEWGEEIDTICIDMGEIVRELCEDLRHQKGPTQAEHVSVACLITGYISPKVACGGVKVLLFPILSIIEQRFKKDHAYWIYYLMIEQVLNKLWDQTEKQDLLLRAVFGDVDEKENEKKAPVGFPPDAGNLLEIIPDGYLQCQLLGVPMKNSKSSTT